MNTYNNTIIKKDLKVNNLHQINLDFLDFIKQEEKSEVSKLSKQEKIKSLIGDKLFKLVPEIHRDYVFWIISNQFKNNADEYIKTIPLFFKLFTFKDKNICDSDIVENDLSKKRRKKKEKKQLILYSAQLLKLIGKDRSKIATKSMVSSYRKEMQEQDDFLQSFRLINAQGKISKLVSNEKKQKQKIAQILKISKCFEDIAKDKKFTFSFITLTLPSSYHPLPLNGATSYDGKTPGQAVEQLNNYWKLIRARLSNLGLLFGDNLFGIQVTECQSDSTLHLHCCLWHSKEDTEDIHKEIRDVSDSSKEKVNFDIKLNNGKAKASTYLFKYVLKPHSTYSDENKNDSAIKNMTARNLYGVRSFNFFGLKGSITKFNFLCKHYLNYKKLLSKEIIYCFESGDLYDFITNYQEYFDNSYIKENGSKKLLGVIFRKGMYENECRELKQVDIVKNNEIAFIRNIQFCVFEKTFEQEIKNVNEIDLSDIDYKSVKLSFDKVINKQNLYDDEIDKIILSNNLYVPKTNVVQLYNIIQGKTEASHFRDYEIRKDECDMREII